LFWNSGKDPDNFAIPYLTAIGDLLGTAFLAVVFHMLYLLGKIKNKVGIWVSP
jgi:solute carrier family 41